MGFPMRLSLARPSPWAGFTAALCAPASALAADGTAAAAVAAAGGALLAALVGAVAFSLWMRRRLWTSEAALAALLTDAELENSIAAQRGEQELRWCHGEAVPTASPGFSRLTGASHVANPFDAFLALLDAADADALAAAVEALCIDGVQFSRNVACRDGRRAFAVRGTSVFAAAGASFAVVSVAERSHDREAIVRLEREVGCVRYLLDQLPLPVWRRGPDQRLVFVNRAYREAVEAAADAAPGELPELAAGVARQSGRELAIRARSTGEPQTDRYHAVTGGARRLIEHWEVPLGAGGEIAGFAIDHTRLEDIQGDLARHIAGHEEILQHLGTAIAVYGPDESLQFFNNAFLRLWGLAESWLRNKPRMSEVLEMLRENRRLPEHADFPAFKSEQLALFTSLLEPVEELVHLPDGATLRSVAIPHPFGGLLLMWEDVTDALALERNYNTLIAVQRETLDNLYEGVAVIGANGRLRLSNPAFGSMWQIPTAALNNEPHISEIVDCMGDMLGEVGDWMAEKERLIALLTGREPHSGRVERIDGSVLDYATVPLPDGGVLLSYIDVSAAINMERALRERNEALETADRLKSEFIANVSYELRTPLNTIIGFTEILAGQYFGELNDRQAEYGHGILESSHRLLMLINDILDLATIEAGHMTLELDSIDLREMLDSVLSLVRERARQKKIVLESDCPPDIGLFVADERRLKQALFNVLSNAIKFTPDGGQVTMRARRSNQELVLTVTDSGIGIDEEDQERVFAKFERGTSPEARRSGAGLGLSLVKSFIELHGGHVALDSRPESGTSVICTLPARGAGASRQPGAA
ncbi:MAG: PAS domain-containing protein [Alphaproteobacteria bacterium]|nr:PAS domain-containing protein [Alphaproteobacteria bacterium]